MFARKFIPTSEVTVLHRELDAINNLWSHRNIIAILEHGEFPPQHHYIDMEFCDIDLRSFIEGMNPSPSRLQDDKIWHIVEDISCGVAFIHLKIISIATSNRTIVSSVNKSCAHTSSLFRDRRVLEVSGLWPNGPTEPSTSDCIRKGNPRLPRSRINEQSRERSV